MRKLHFCTHKVNRSNIKRENRKGVEHIVITSFTLPPNIVMNGGLYPAEEIDKSFESLNRTPVTVEHPEIDGMFVSASDPEIDFDFRFGAFNENARKMEDGRIALDKVINVQKALKTEKGKRLLDRIEELETNEKARPIHTSVGVFVDVEETELATNDRGQEFTWIAKNMIFDHDAILLDSVGASTPEQGTGIGINKQQIKVSHFVLEDNASSPSRKLPLADNDTKWDSSQAVARWREKSGSKDKPSATYKNGFMWYDADNSEEFGAYKLPFVDVIDGEAKAVPNAIRNVLARLNQTQGPSDSERSSIKSVAESYLNRSKDMRNNGEMSFREIEEKIHQEINQGLEFNENWVVAVFEDSFIFETQSGELFKSNYLVDEMGNLGIQDTRLPVERVVEFKPINTTEDNEGDNAMRDQIIAELSKLGITVNADISEYDLTAELKKALAANKGDDNANGNIAELIANAVKEAVTPLNEKIESLDSQLQNNASEELNKLADFIVNSKKRPEFTKEDIVSLGIEKARSIAANCGQSYDIGGTMQINNQESEAFKTNAEDLPE